MTTWTLLKWRGLLSTLMYVVLWSVLYSLERERTGLGVKESATRHSQVLTMVCCWLPVKALLCKMEWASGKAQHWKKSTLKSSGKWFLQRTLQPLSSRCDHSNGALSLAAAFRLCPLSCKSLQLLPWCFVFCIVLSLCGFLSLKWMFNNCWLYTCILEKK